RVLLCLVIHPSRLTLFPYTTLFRSDVERLLTLRIRLDPLFCLGNHFFCCVDNFVDQTDLLGFFSLHALTLHQHIHQGVLHTHHAHSTDDTAGTRQQAQRHFRQTELGLRVVQGNTAVTRQRDFQTASQRGAVQGSDNRNAEGFQLAQVAFKHLAAVSHLLCVILGDL